MLLVVLALGMVAALFVTRRGQDVRAGLSDMARSLLDATGLNAGMSGQGPATDDGDLQARIEETRRRLKEQLAEDTTQES
jgi:hypothetical protein